MSAIRHIFVPDQTMQSLCRRGASNEALSSSPASRKWPPAIFRNPAVPLIKMRLRRRWRQLVRRWKKERGHSNWMSSLTWSGQRGSNSSPASRKWPPAIFRNPAAPLIKMRLRRRWRQLVRRWEKRKRTSKLDVLSYLERATRLELATSTLARWRSTR